MEVKRNNKLHAFLLIIIGGFIVGPILLMSILFLWNRYIPPIKHEKVYYISQIKMFVKLEYNSSRDFGYIYFSPINNFNESDGKDFIELHKRSKYFTTAIHVTSSDRKKIYVMDEDKSLLSRNSFNYEIIHVQWLCDTSYVEINSTIMPIFPDCYWSDSTSLKQEHITIVPGSYFEKLFISDIKDSVLYEAVEVDKFN